MVAVQHLKIADVIRRVTHRVERRISDATATRAGMRGTRQIMAHLQRSSLRRYPLGTHQSFAAKSKRDRFLNPHPAAGQHK